MRNLMILAVALLASAGQAFAETYVVDPYGTGDLPTIQAAVDAVADGDVIELTDGTFTGAGNRDVDFLGKSLTVRSGSGNPEACILDCEGSEAEAHRAFSAITGEHATLTGITVTGSWILDEPYGGAILCDGMASLTIQSCVFRGNWGGVLVCREETNTTVEGCVFRQNAGNRCGAVRTRLCTITMTDCEFLENTVNLSGGAYYGYGARATIERCTFTRNDAVGWGGAVSLTAFEDGAIRDCFFDGNTGHYGGVHVYISTATIERCTFVRNTVALGTGKSSDTLVRNCTFWGNASHQGSLLLSDSGTTMQNCVVAGETIGPSMNVEGGVVLSCCDLWGNAGGDWVGRFAEQYGVSGNICEDPIFCHPELDDFTIREDSPCAPFSPQNPDCDLVGAWPIGCYTTAVPDPSWDRTTATWGAVKSRFR